MIPVYRAAVAQARGDVAETVRQAGITLRGRDNAVLGTLVNFTCHPTQHGGDTIGSAGWQAITNPMLAAAGVDPASVKYVEAGNAWGQTLAQGQADAKRALDQR